MKINQRGFTLVELLVVIAIIGILSGLMFIYINPKKKINSANDVKLKTSIDTTRFLITDYFSRNNNSFEHVDNDEKIKKILDDYNLTLISDIGAWAVKGELTNGNYFCRDYLGNATEKTTQDITDYMCD